MKEEYAMFYSTFLEKALCPEIIRILNQKSQVPPRIQTRPVQAECLCSTTRATITAILCFVKCIQTKTHNKLLQLRVQIWHLWFPVALKHSVGVQKSSRRPSENFQKLGLAKKYGSFHLHRKISLFSLAMNGSFSFFSLWELANGKYFL